MRQGLIHRDDAVDETDKGVEHLRHKYQITKLDINNDDNVSVSSHGSLGDDGPPDERTMSASIPDETNMRQSTGENKNFNYAVTMETKKDFEDL